MHYIYYSYEEFGRGYLGKRMVPPGLTPETDIEYFGSYEDETFNPTQKIILFVVKTDKEASIIEEKLQRFFDVVNNPHFANQCIQNGPKFSSYGRKMKQSSKNKISQKNKGKIPWNKGKKHKVSSIQKMKDTLAQSNRVPWNKNKKGCQEAWNKGKKMPPAPGKISYHKEYYFVNVKSGQIIKKTTREMIKLYGGNKTTYYRMRNKGKLHKNWKYMEINSQALINKFDFIN